ncbi:MAG: 30S ribosomal protein S13 [Candidatus Spechtbacteria bacterium RIFCSPLOWO2_01_FULL_46_10]|uniref:Small ribosomal subunit protein uS13 n=1 Tax=Candidatus Spechtbacteria bacterium RIFCSPLOWO2_01_FULL_46_10 TaxID=1802163 RepID=A0A1G2HHK9_9BACT|nr:MAG: 30S ribosomal protein S13 [Candidatus Spechtbacteria bacterium RIFCSPLOWO2_01_FULL_46_10]
MARIAGVEIPDNKRIVIALTYIKGIGNVLSAKILKDAKIDENTRAKDLTSDQVNTIRNVITEHNFVIEGDLVRVVRENIKRLRDIGSYRGLRHAKHLPVRGQQTRTNSRTVRGNKRMTVGSGRKPPAMPT